MTDQFSARFVVKLAILDVAELDEPITSGFGALALEVTLLIGSVLIDLLAAYDAKYAATLP